MRAYGLKLYCQSCGREYVFRPQHGGLCWECSNKIVSVQTTATDKTEQFKHNQSFEDNNKQVNDINCKCTK
jgi:hypothetical protein